MCTHLIHYLLFPRRSRFIVVERIQGSDQDLISVEVLGKDELRCESCFVRMVARVGTVFGDEGRVDCERKKNEERYQREEADAGGRKRE